MELTVFGACGVHCDVSDTNIGFKDGQVLYARQEVRECDLQVSCADKMGQCHRRGVQLDTIRPQRTAMVRIPRKISESRP